MVRIEPTAEASLAAIRERSRFGIAIAAMIKIIATTINNSISEKPFCCFFILPFPRFSLRQTKTNKIHFPPGKALQGFQQFESQIPRPANSPCPYAQLPHNRVLIDRRGRGRMDGNNLATNGEP